MIGKYLIWSVSFVSSMVVMLLFYKVFILDILKFAVQLAICMLPILLLDYFWGGIIVVKAIIIIALTTIPLHLLMGKLDFELKTAIRIVIYSDFFLFGISTLLRTLQT